MSDKREFANIDTSKDVMVPGKPKEPTLPLFIPMRIVRWVLYSAGFACLSLPFATNYWQLACAGLILGHFASQLNALINKK